jgi:hypothetical protein
VIDTTAHDDAEMMETAAAQGAAVTDIGGHFEPWRRRHARLSRELRDLPYLLPPPAASAGI